MSIYFVRPKSCSDNLYRKSIRMRNKKAHVGKKKQSGLINQFKIQSVCICTCANDFVACLKLYNIIPLAIYTSYFNLCHCIVQ